MGKRGQGEGSIYQRADGRWAAAISVGRSRRQTFYGKTRGEVQRRLTAALRARDEGRPVSQSRQRLGRYLDAWLATTRPNVSPSTWQNDASRIRLHIEPALGDVLVSELTPSDIEEFMRRKLDEGLSTQTVIHLRGILRRAMKRALRDGLVLRNAAQLADPPALRRTREPAFYDVAEARRFLAAVQGDRLEALWIMALTTGLRRGELLALTWAEIDLELGTYRVERALQRSLGELRIISTKSRKSIRTGNLPSLAVEVLRVHRERQQAAGLRPLPAAYVFTSTAGTLLEPRNVNRAFAALLRRADLRPIRLHDLRHSFGSLLLASGATAREVMELLGHSQIAMTMNVYAHVLEESKRTAVDRLDALLRGETR